ncbi:hypothetical protein HQQ81_12185 [Microbacteriaceae bacterium VKM Ac-2854]|nr:hypothetical protein [Microbacteriaceae bacterium VKM Ac-2854]
MLALQSHADETSALSAGLTLGIAVVGTLLAVFVADLISHLVVHQSLPNRGELRHMIAVGVGAGTVLIAPVLLLLAAGAGWWTTADALAGAIVALVLSLVLVGYLAIRRLSIPLLHKAAVLIAEVVLSLLVIALELVAHLG